MDTKNAAVKKIKITLHIDTGNIIYEEFDNHKEAEAFLKLYSDNPQAILDKITPKKRKSP